MINFYCMLFLLMPQLFRIRHRTVGLSYYVIFGNHYVRDAKLLIGINIAHFVTTVFARN